MTPDKPTMETLSKLVESAQWKLQEARAVNLVRRQREHPGPFIMVDPSAEEVVILKALIQAAIEHICVAMATSEIALAVPKETDEPCP